MNNCDIQQNVFDRLERKVLFKIKTVFGKLSLWNFYIKDDYFKDLMELNLEQFELLKEENEE